MEILELSSQEYGQVFNRPYHVFNSAEFSEMNKYKCDKLHYLAFKDSKVRLGLYVKPGLWRDLDDFSSGAVCMVLASEVYKSEDYIREYKDFIAYRQ